MSMFKRIRLYLVIGLCAAPMMFGTTPFMPCEIAVVSGRVVMPNDSGVAGIEVAIEYFDGSGPDLLVLDFPFPDGSATCASDYPLYNHRDTTDGEGTFNFTMSAEEFNFNLQDSLRIIIAVPNDSVVIGDRFSVSDTTFVTPIFGDAPDSPGCSYSSSPQVRIGSIYVYEDRRINLP